MKKYFKLYQFLTLKNVNRNNIGVFTNGNIKNYEEITISYGKDYWSSRKTNEG